MSGRHWLDLPRGGLRLACPRRHLFALPRGRGPSQTPKFLSPGPPSPWLPALFTRAASQLPRSRRVSERYPSPTSQGVKPHSGHLLGRLCKCRKRFNARGAGGGAPGEIK